MQSRKTGTILATGMLVLSTATGLQANGGDTCGTATVIPALPFSDIGDTSLAANDYDTTLVDDCPLSAIGAPDVVYKFTPNVLITVDITLCENSAYDTRLYVYENTCPGVVIGCDDDSCATASLPDPWASELTALSMTAGNTYYIVVDGYSTESGPFTIHVEGEQQQVCGDGAVEGTEDCDDGNTEDGDCCASDCTFEFEGAPCGDPSDSVCDDPDTCDGAGECLPRHEDTFAICRLAASECDALDFCDGAGNCPPDGFHPEGTPCGDPTDTECDRADTCDGFGACQENVAPAGTACGDPTDADCDNPDTCDGLGTCQENNEPDDTPCPDDFFCNGEETCFAGDCVDNEDPCALPDEQCDEDDDLCIILADLDVKPGSCPNSVNSSSQGVVPLALVGSDMFDVLDVDVSTLALRRADGVGGGVAPLEGPPGPHTVVDDVATPFAGEWCECHELEDDGFDDLSMKFSTPDLAEILQLDGFSHGDVVELLLVGELLDGTRFEASDCITVKGRNGERAGRKGRINTRR
ncbi:MAG: hypothetical protein PVI86_01945 [Phycisphaerae bacterium]|jgi:cysteine-rich repeat protein